MNSDINELAHAVLKKPLHECSLEELQEIAEQYPYFGPIQLLLAKKILEGPYEQEDNSARYEEQVQKTSLYFQNRVWLHHLLNKNGDNGSFADQPVTTPEETLITTDEQNKPDEFITNEDKENEIIHTNVKEEAIEEAPLHLETSSNDIEPSGQVGTIETKEEQADPVVNPEIPTGQVSSPMEMPSLKIEPIAANTGLVFEPYHTVDYFASQGIKFKEEEKPKDRFGVQLKSFTEWLKTLKQAPVSQMAKNTDSNAEKKVEQMAEYSLAERHVITEAMAEVWKKQGNRARAEEIYRKLSLLDPSKSSYFAAKIEELKKTS